MTIALDTQTCRDFEKASALEWLCTNGLGGFASGTVAGVNTRKYHGYLVVAAKPPVQRYVCLSRVEDRVVVEPRSKGGTAVVADLSTNEFADVIHPQGYQNLVSFQMRAGPVWRYQVADVVIEKSITLIHGQDTVIVRYEIVSGGGGRDVRIQMLPMLAGRDFHGTIGLHHRPSWRIDEASDDGTLLVSAPECPVKLAFSHNAKSTHLNTCWWYNFTFRLERQRGYPDREDLWTPGMLEFVLEPGKPVGFICATKLVAWDRQAELVAQEESRQNKLAASLSIGQSGPAGENADGFLSSLAQAADQFIVQRTNGGGAGGGGQKMSVIAGYPWFEDWGRDTFIALPGLTLVTGRYEAARLILATFADHRRRGLLPNRFPDKSHTPEYHTVDAALWFVQAAYEYWRYTGDVKFLTTYLYPALCEIVESYRDGTDFGIRMDPADGLIRAGQPQVQLTWMDAKVGDWVVTPRHGKPVEINALWYNALKIMEMVSREAGDAPRVEAFAFAAARAKANFARTFFNAETDSLFDVVSDEGQGDGAIRPNQVLAVSLPFSPLDAPMQRKVVAAAQKYLLTPLGLRTLSPSCNGYHGRCAGDQMARDMAYHQGTVWPWLIGPFISAYVKVAGGSIEARRQAWAFLSPMQDHLKKFGLGSICEIADGDSPHTPRGCPAQAWSVGEVLRCYWEDILARAPEWPQAKQSAAPLERGAVKV